MTVQDYLYATLSALKEPTPKQDIGNIPLEDAIFAKVMSKKFRKLKADADAIAITKKAIHLSVEKNKPIAVNVIFGGNKLWHFDEAPEIDWAEFFATTYLLRWMKSIAGVYEPGAYLEFYSEDVVLETMNNLPKAETDQYSATFKAMLDWLRPYLPPNVTVGYKRYGDEYNDPSEFLAELEEAKAKVLKELGGKLPELTPHQKTATELNVRLRPGQADDPLWREKAELIHKSIERTKTMERYIGDPAWVAVGALERDSDSYTEVVLTPTQLETAQFDWEGMSLEGLEGKNFKRIRVLRSKLGSEKADPEKRPQT
jgi:hypothetical protein